MKVRTISFLLIATVAFLIFSGCNSVDGLGSIAAEPVESDPLLRLKKEKPPRLNEIELSKK